MAEFRLKLRGYRKANGKKQSELGTMLGVPQTTISKWENGLQRPSAEHAEKLSQLMGIPIGELLGLWTQAELSPESNRGFAEMKQASIKHDTKPLQEAADKQTHHPAYGALKGMITIPPGVDLTEPSYSDWRKLYGEDK